jgi:hypothetical protein
MIQENQEPNYQLADAIVRVLNEAVAMDRPAIAALVANRVPCNPTLAAHPTIQIGAQHGGFHVGMLGILNGICGIRSDGTGVVAAVFEEVEIKQYPWLKEFVVLRGQSIEGDKAEHL